MEIAENCDEGCLDTLTSLCYIIFNFSKFFNIISIRSSLPKRNPVFTPQKFPTRRPLPRRKTLTKSRPQQMVERLRDLQASSPDIEASAVVSVDGLSIASALPHYVEEDRVSAMSAAMISLGERIASELGRGELDQVYIKGEAGYVILMSVGEEAVLTALAGEQAKLGLIFLDMRRATEALSELI